MLPSMLSAGASKAVPACVCSATAAKSVVRQFVPNGDVARNSPWTSCVGKKSHSCATNFYAVRRGDVFGHSIVINSKVGSESCGCKVARPWMRCQNDSTLQGIVLDNIAYDQIVMAFCGFVTDENPVGIAGDEVVGHNHVHRADQMNRTAHNRRFRRSHTCRYPVRRGSR